MVCAIERNLRLNAKNVAHAPCLVAVLLVGLAKRVDVVDTNDPLVLLELDVSAEVVHVADERSKNFALAGFGLGAHETDDMVCEVGVELGSTVGAVCTVGSHCGGYEEDVEDLGYLGYLGYDDGEKQQGKRSR